MKPRLLDLFCGAGGASMGYHRAGFEVIGVDLHPQKNYPFEFLQADAIKAITFLLNGDMIETNDGREFVLSDFHAIHASPPCQAFTHARHLGRRGRLDHPRLIAPIRQLLHACGAPFVIENVEGARNEMHSPLLLCGTMFGLPLIRHRLFESNVAMLAPVCQHRDPRPAIFASTPRSDGSRPATRFLNQMASATKHNQMAAVMEIDWLPARPGRPAAGLREAIPPAYTFYIGRHLMALYGGER